jgi:hypothetical protein
VTSTSKTQDKKDKQRMPSVKVTKLLEVLDATVAELKAGDPFWTPAQRKAAKEAAEVFKAFRLLSAQQCSDAAQTIPPDGPVPDRVAGTKKTAAKTKSRKR